VWCSGGCDKEDDRGRKKFEVKNLIERRLKINPWKKRELGGEFPARF